MKMDQLGKELTATKAIASAVYAAALVYAVLIYLGVLPLSYVDAQIVKIMFFVFLASVPAIFFISVIIGEQWMGSEKLTKVFHDAGDTEIGLSAVIAHVRTGAIMMAAMGEACAIYGLIIHMVSDDPVRPWIFLGLSISHYPLTMAKLSRVRGDIERFCTSPRRHPTLH
jgi:hypothetical protein